MEQVIMPKTMARKSITQCCALSQISAGNHTPKASIARILWVAQRQKKYNWYGTPHGNGEKAFICIVVPGENVLEQNLIELGFKDIAQFERRSGYPEIGNLKMYFINI